MKRKRFFFSEWTFLAKVAPEMFESRRRKVIGEVLGECGNQLDHRESLQAEIDMARIRKESPEKAILEIARTLNERLSSLDEKLAALVEKMNASRSRHD